VALKDHVLNRLQAGSYRDHFYITYRPHEDRPGDERRRCEQKRARRFRRAPEVVSDESLLA
jgi:hypothetical protein